MTNLPPGWTETSVGEIAASVKNGISVSRPGTDPAGVPILRISSVRALALDLSDVRYAELDAAALGNSGALLREGDLLFTRYNGNPEYVAACARVPALPGPLTYPDKLIRVRVNQFECDPRYMAIAMASPAVREQVRELCRTTAGQVGISGASIRKIRFPLPPVAEQQRIAEILESHLSHLDAAAQSIRADIRRLRMLAKRTIIDAVPLPPPGTWQLGTVADAGSVDLGRQRHPDWHSGPDMKPYLRVANVFEDRIDASDLMEMNFPPEVFERFRLSKGDILLNEGQSPEFLGRPAMYKGDPPEVAFTNSLIRFRARRDVMPEWALLVFRRHMHAGRFVREVRISTNIAHLSASRFKTVEFPVPPIAEQERIVAETGERLTRIEWMRQTLVGTLARTVSLRRALIAEAVAGRSVPQDAAEPVMRMPTTAGEGNEAASPPSRTRIEGAGIQGRLWP